MIFSISFKDPNALFHAIDEQLSYEEPTDEELAAYDGYDDMLAAWREDKAEELKEFVSKWVQYGEYVSIEFDTEKGTAEVETVK